MTSSIPREVNGKWYPVPCPEGITLAQSFPTREACEAACETSDAYDVLLDDVRLNFDENMADAVETASDESYDNGRSDGRDLGWSEHIEEECEEGLCPGYDKGWADGYAQGKGEKLPA